MALYIFKVLFVILLTNAFNNGKRNKDYPPRYWKIELSDSVKIKMQLDSMIAVK
jgi:hypothetical protein